MPSQFELTGMEDCWELLGNVELLLGELNSDDSVIDELHTFPCSLLLT